jgi:cell division protein FtsQ
MKKKLISILTWITWMATGSALMVLMGFARQTYFNSPLREIKLNIQQVEGGGFLLRDSLRNEISAVFHGGNGQPMKAIRTEPLLNQLSLIPWVESVKASTAIDGTLKVWVVERIPVIRVFAQSGHSVYLDKQGYIFIPCSHHTTRVLVANGDIDFEPLTFGRTSHISAPAYKKSLLPDVLAVGKTLIEEPFAHALIDQVYVSDSSGFELIPKFSNINIILGDTSSLQDKVQKFSAFFRQKLTSPELLDYKAINVTFKNQVVCIKY